MVCSNIWKICLFFLCFLLIQSSSGKDVTEEINDLVQENGEIAGSLKLLRIVSSLLTSAGYDPKVAGNLENGYNSSSISTESRQGPGYGFVSPGVLGFRPGGGGGPGPNPPPQGYPPPPPPPIGGYPFPPGFRPPLRPGLPSPDNYPIGNFGRPPPPPGPFPFRPFPGSPHSFPGLGPFGSITDALASLATYDDLRCIPRLLCEVASGGRTGFYSRQESFIPFINRDSILTLLTVFNFGDSSPLVAFGRAILLGVTSGGDPNVCFAGYPLCPRDPDRLVYYLNNHRGGFFRLFGQNPGAFRDNSGEQQERIQTLPQQPSAGIAQDSIRSGKTIRFPKDVTHQESGGFFHGLSDDRPSFRFEVLDLQKPLPNHVPSAMIFPDRTGTGELRLDVEDDEYNGKKQRKRKGKKREHIVVFIDNKEESFKFPSFYNKHPFKTSNENKIRENFFPKS